MSSYNSIFTEKQGVIVQAQQAVSAGLKLTQLLRASVSNRDTEEAAVRDLAAPRDRKRHTGSCCLAYVLRAKFLVSVS